MSVATVVECDVMAYIVMGMDATAASMEGSHVMIATVIAETKSTDQQQQQQEQSRYVKRQLRWRVGGDGSGGSSSKQWQISLWLNKGFSWKLEENDFYSR